MNSDPSLARELAEMRRRLDRLERSARLTRSAASDDAGVKRIEFGELTEDGTETFGLRVRDADGDAVLLVTDQGLVKASLSDGTIQRVEIGEYVNPDTAAADFGLLVRSSTGVPVFQVGNAGQSLPASLPHVQNPNLGALHSSGSWSTAFRYRVPHLTANGFYLRGRISVGVGISSAQARLLGANGAVTSSRALTTGGSFVDYEWEWLHGQPTDGTATYVEYQTRITGGAGTIDVADVALAYYVGGSVIGATAAGF